MSIEQDQEKLINTSAQIANNAITTAANLISLKKPQTKVEIRTAQDQVKQTQGLMQQGASPETIRQTIANSSIVKRLSQVGGNVQKYTDLIIKKARINNAMQNNQEQPQSLSKKISKTR